MRSLQDVLAAIDQVERETLTVPPNQTRAQVERLAQLRELRTIAQKAIEVDNPSTDWVSIYFDLYGETFTEYGLPEHDYPRIQKLCREAVKGWLLGFPERITNKTLGYMEPPDGILI